MADELQQANTRLLDAFDVVPEGLVLLDAQGRYVMFNKRFVELYDLMRDQIVVGGSFVESVRIGMERGQYLDNAGDHANWLTRRIERNRDHRSSSEQHIHGDRWLRVEERRTADGGSIGVRIDITDLKRREQTLRKRSEQLSEAQSLGRMGDWSYALGTRDFWGSPQVFQLLKYDQGQSAMTRHAVLSLLVGDGAQRIMAAQATVLRTGDVASTDVQVRRGDASVGDFVVTSKPMMDDAGRAIGFCGTIQDISERKSAERALEKLAYFDPLTGLANRALFHRDLDEVFHRCLRTGSRAALLILDLDRFKEVNDSLGHAAGDKVLVEVARIISRVLGADHFLARLGGDEFAIIIREFTDEASVRLVAAEIIDKVHSSMVIENSEVSVGTSIGIAVIPRDGSDLADLQRNADLALYRAKEEGRNRFRFFDSHMSDVVLYKLALARDLRRAISSGHVGQELSVHYQPQVDLAHHRVAGFEALMRWNHPVLGSIPPSEFIPVAESSQLICDLGRWILRQAAVQAREWIDAGEPPTEISVNVSAAQIWHTDFCQDVADVLDETGLPPHLLCLELTESLLIAHGEVRVETVLKKLKTFGVSLALDDFGTDYSSLGYLTRLPFDKLKIDRIFVKGIAGSARARNLLEGIIALGRGLGMTLVVEGAETAEEIDIIRQLRADIVQGFGFARPSNAADAMAFASAFGERFHVAHRPWPQEHGGPHRPEQTMIAAE